MSIHELSLIEKTRQRVRVDDDSLRSFAQRAKAGDVEAFGELYARAYGPTFSQVLKRVGEREVAEELTQEAFLHAFRGIGSLELRPGVPIMAWITTIARYTVINHYRARSVRPRANGSLVGVRERDTDPSIDPERQALSNEGVDIIWERVVKLRGSERAVTVLMGQERTQTEATAELDMNPNSFRVSLHRARKSLKRELRQKDIDI